MGTTTRRIQRISIEGVEGSSPLSETSFSRCSDLCTFIAWPVFEEPCNSGLDNSGVGRTLDAKHEFPLMPPRPCSAGLTVNLQISKVNRSCVTVLRINRT
ncbi:hypothetical protein MPTK1_5g06630 [Marchantia polymorpha subsp. ruderalis]|uniref:Uncharacterized protein n=2 Tax=Marchantia polymorpha TaxID=3197 RepID=A0AAF6BFN0_MARPO|nr:hypothetical protein MARPO_0171s0020 [Marchantia polymorpha]BBN10814.1 hypothetical protein Mp_5g06630 [Marchantia polymorpha subsp. ruderalis]|eukprot:PTQ28178.1 hypothetical protein MARPO_0171s0020 [Marchantia polymorpha]